MKVKRNLDTIEISDINEDVVWNRLGLAPDYEGGWHINFIQWVPGTADDLLVIRNGNGVDDPTVYHNWAQGANVDLPRYFYGARVKFFIDYSECVFSSGHKVIVQFMPIGGRFMR